MYTKVIDSITLELYDLDKGENSLPLLDTLIHQLKVDKLYCGYCKYEPCICHEGEEEMYGMLHERLLKSFGQILFYKLNDQIWELSYGEFSSTSISLVNPEWHAPEEWITFDSIEEIVEELNTPFYQEKYKGKIEKMLLDIENWY